RVEGGVRAQPREAVAAQVPEDTRALRPPARQPRAVDDVGDAALDRLDQRGNVRRVVFEVGVLDHRYVAVGVGDGGADSRALTAVLLAEEHDAVASVLPALGDVAGPGRRPVVDDDDLLVAGGRPAGVAQG